MPQMQIPANSLWRDRSFVLFWLARNVSILGSTITTVVLPILVFRLTGSALQTSLLATFEVVPYFFFGLFAGAIADRVNRRRLMVICDLISTALLGSIPLVAMFGTLTLTQIYAVALLSATVFVWFDAANFGALPMLVGRERIIEANSLLWSTHTLIWVIGPAIGGILAATIDPALAIGLDSLSYILSAVALVLIPRALSATYPAEASAKELVRRTLSDIREGLQFLWQQRLVRDLTFLGFGNSFTGGAVLGLLVVYAVQGLGLAKKDPNIGLLFAAGAIGALVASLLVPRLNKSYSTGRIALTGLFLNPVMLLGMVLAPSFGVGIIFYTLWTMCYTLFIVTTISLRQIVTPDRLQSRVNASARLVAWGGQPFGAAVGGLVAEATTVRIAYIVVGLGVVVSAAAGWFSSLRQGEKVSPKLDSVTKISQD